NFGTSYIQGVTFDERGPVAQGLLTYGQSSDVASPRAYDQLPLFSAKRWQSLPFHPDDVAAQRDGPVVQLAYWSSGDVLAGPQPDPRLTGCDLSHLLAPLLLQVLDHFDVALDSLHVGI